MAGLLAAVDVQDLAGDEARRPPGRVTASTISSISPIRPTGCRAARNSCVSAGCIGVRMMPGATALTRMPRAAYSMASDLVTAFRPPLVSDASADGTLLIGVVDQAGGDVDDVPAALRQHRRDGALGELEEPAQVDPEDQVVVVGGVLGERLGDEDAGVVDQRVDPAELVAAPASIDPVGQARARRCRPARSAPAGRRTAAIVRELATTA